MIIIKAINPIKMNGHTPLTIFENGKPVGLLPINKFKPKGGVNIPIAPLATIIIPRWIGSTPIFIAMGKKIGAKIRIKATPSTNIPAINIIIFIINSIIIGLLIFSITLERYCGIPPIVKTHDKAEAPAIIIITVAVVNAESMQH